MDPKQTSLSKKRNLSTTTTKKKRSSKQRPKHTHKQPQSTRETQTTSTTTSHTNQPQTINCNKACLSTAKHQKNSSRHKNQTTRTSQKSHNFNYNAVSHMYQPSEKTPYLIQSLTTQPHLQTSTNSKITINYPPNYNTHCENLQANCLSPSTHKNFYIFFYSIH